MTLKLKVLSGVKWTVSANIIKQVMNLVSIVILARLLTPDDFGVFAILMIFIGFLGMFVEMGSSAAIIHMDKISDKLLSSIFYFNVFSGVLFCILLFVLSGPISVFFENPEIEELLKWLSFTFVIGSFSGVQKALFSKKLEFKTISIIGTVTTFSSLAIGIVAAINGFGVYSLIIRTMADTILLTTLTWYISSWKPGLMFSLEELKKVFHFATNLTGYTFINYFSKNADNFLIGKFLGSSNLGVYNMAYNIMLYPLQNISHVFMKVLFPAFSLIKDDNEKFKRGYLRVIFFVALVSFPLMTGLMATSEIFVSVVFGEKWHNLAIILLIMAPIGMIQSIAGTTGSLYLAKGNVKTLFKIGSLNAIVAVVSFIVGIPFGIEGVALSYLVANIIMLYPVLTIAWRQIDLGIKEGLSEIYPILLFSTIMGVAVAFLGKNFEDIIEGQIVRLIAMVLSGIIIYLILLRIKYGNLIDMFNEIRNK